MAKNKNQQTTPSQRTLDFVRRDSLYNSSDEDHNQEQVDDLGKSIKESMHRIKEDLNRIDRDFNRALALITTRVEVLETKDAETQRHISALETKVCNFEKSNENLLAAVNKQERFSRKCNLRIVGYPHSEGEDCVAISKGVFCTVGLQDAEVLRAHRDGASRPNQQRPRHILVRLSTFQDKLLFYGSSEPRSSIKNILSQTISPMLIYWRSGNGVIVFPNYTRKALNCVFCQANGVIKMVNHLTSPNCQDVVV
ncbi:hypothetical protein BSL78_16059 [Apostichopus japonicus]|uniref:Uncharacterized protein n=1 Tax=Stichopus japonicus TaxID=307972 RepID=A0A2G8KGE1_STIJA|nr:hypothetical protein BSL78_16059 [Apostichopus japonicus]